MSDIDPIEAAKAAGSGAGIFATLLALLQKWAVGHGISEIKESVKEQAADMKQLMAVNNEQQVTLGEIGTKLELFEKLQNARDERLMADVDAKIRELDARIDGLRDEVGTLRQAVLGRS